jgi:hypothetical protein
MVLPRPHALALFHRHIAGDEALLRLAQRRLQTVGLGAEFYPETVEELEQQWALRPAGATAHAAHLPRHLDVRQPAHQQTVLAFARQFAGRLHGLVVHDHRGWGEHLEQAAEALAAADQALRTIAHRPALFVEYASGLALESFTNLCAALADCPHVSSCIDIGHIGIFNAKRILERKHPGIDLGSLSPESVGLRGLLPDLTEAVTAGLPAVLQVVSSVAAWGKPIHFHLHDGHPLVSSQYGVCDHQSFFQRIRLPFSYRGSRELPLLFGPEGLERIVQTALEAPAQPVLSFTLEIHPAPGREALGEHADLFYHWSDLTNAERMNYWLSQLLENHQLLQEICTRCAAVSSG